MSFTYRLIEWEPDEGFIFQPIKVSVREESLPVVIVIIGGIAYNRCWTSSPDPYSNKKRDKRKVKAERRLLGNERGIDSKTEGGKGPLLDLLIHDLTGPLSVASTSAAGLLQRESRYGALTDEQKRLIERILRNVRKAQTLLNEMIEISRSEEGLFQRELFPIEEILKESLLDVLEVHDPQVVEKLSGPKSLGESRALLENLGIFISMTGKYCELPFCHDHKKVQQILRNLFSNSMKYRRSRVEVCISGDVDLCVSFEDDGVGIPPEDQEAIFDRFVRIKEKRHAGIPGLGLGLTGVKALLEAMRGEISVASREGSGARFVVRIPPLPPP